MLQTFLKLFLIKNVVWEHNFLIYDKNKKRTVKKTQKLNNMLLFAL